MFAFHSSDDKAVLENKSTGCCIKILQCSSPELKEFVKTKREDAFSGLKNVEKLDYEALYGFYELSSGPYIALVVESDQVIDLPEFSLNYRKVTRIVILPLFRSSTRHLSEDQHQEEDKYLELLHETFSSHQFFFSLTTDITHTMQRLHNMPEATKSEPICLRAHDHFFWNRDNLIDLFSLDGVANNEDSWIVPMCCGFLEKFKCAEFQFLLISRRSRHFQGTRYLKRGIDEVGHVANFAETEQICIVTTNSIKPTDASSSSLESKQQKSAGKPCLQLNSYVIIRGSVPLIWSQYPCLKYAPKVKPNPMNVDDVQGLLATRSHFEEIDKSYLTFAEPQHAKEIVCVNLINFKKDEGMLGLAYDATIKKLESRLPTRLRYIWFDFHKETKKSYKNADSILGIIKQAPTNYFSIAEGSRDASKMQTTILRVNCIDNLDRTNLVQSLCCREMLSQQINYSSFDKQFKNLWADHADFLSFLYAGTGALKTDYTRTGKRSWKGVLNDGKNSVMRYYLNNFCDGRKQDGIDLMLGRFSPKDSVFSMSRQSMQQQDAFRTISQFVFLIFVFFFSLFSFVFGSGKRTLATTFSWALMATFVLLLVLAYVFVKKGNSYGEKLVNLPILASALHKTSNGDGEGRTNASHTE